VVAYTAWSLLRSASADAPTAAPAPSR
jgi:hypothetical protein